MIPLDFNDKWKRDHNQTQMMETQISFPANRIILVKH